MFQKDCFVHTVLSGRETFENTTLKVKVKRYSELPRLLSDPYQEVLPKQQECCESLAATASQTILDSNAVLQRNW